MADPSAIHQALADPTRATLMARLHDAGAAGLCADELAELEGLHRTTVGEHLHVLAAAGLVRSAPQRHGRPGRPRIRYWATGADSDDAAMQLLARGLANALGSGPDAHAAATDAGARLGQDLPLRSPTVDALVEALARLGFDPTREALPEPARADVRLRRCPFGEVAAERPDVVCGLHLGLMQGLLSDADVDVEALEPLLADGTCLARVASSGGDPGK